MEKRAEVEKNENLENPFSRTREKVFRVRGGKDILKVLKKHLEDQLEAMMKFVLVERGLPFEWRGENFDPWIHERADCIPQEISGEFWREILNFAQEKVKAFFENFDEDLSEPQEGFDTAFSRFLDGLREIEDEIREEFLWDGNFNSITLFSDEFLVSRGRGSIFVFDSTLRETFEEDPDFSGFEFEDVLLKDFSDKAELFLEIPEGEELPENDQIGRVEIFRRDGNLYVKFVVVF